MARYQSSSKRNGNGGGDGHDGGGGPAVALLYRRISGAEHQKEGLSLDSQQASTRAYAAERGWLIGDEFTDIMTGRRADRPDYQRMLGEARRLRTEGQPVVIVVKWVHRLGRKLSESVRAREEFKALGIVCHSTQEGGAISDVVANTLANIAQYQSDQIGEQIAETIKYVQGNGWHQLGAPAWGYRWRRATEAERLLGAPRKVLDVEGSEQPAVLEAFDRAARGETARAIAAWAQTLPPAATGGRKLGHSQIGFALSSPVYVSRQRLTGTKGRAPEDVLALPDQRWPRLVDDAVWLRVQHAMAARAGTRRPATGRYLLASFVWCPKCGRRMNSRPGHGGGQARYVCSGTKERLCWYAATAPLVDQSAAEQTGALVAAAQSPRLRAALEREWARLREPAAAAESAVASRRRLDAEVAKLRQRVVNATKLFADGAIDKPAYDAMLADTQQELREREAERDALTRGERGRDGPRPAQLPPLEEALAEVGGWTDAVAREDVPAQRVVLTYLVQRVVPERTGWGKYVARVEWTPVGQALHRLAEALTGAHPEGA